MSKKTLTFLLIVVLLVVVGFFIFTDNLDMNTSSGSSPKTIVKTFYGTWINYEAEDILKGTYRDSELITDKFVERIGAAKKVDPVLCSQDLPKHFEVQLLAKTASSSTVEVKEYFGNNPSTLEVSLIKKEGKWLIDQVECSPAVGKEGSFTKTGNLVKDLPGLEREGWFLSYEREGEPGLTVKLEFDEESNCSFKNKHDACKELLAENLIGTRVKVEGEKDEKKVLVEKLIEQ